VIVWTVSAHILIDVSALGWPPRQLVPGWRWNI